MRSKVEEMGMDADGSGEDPTQAGQISGRANGALPGGDEDAEDAEEGGRLPAVQVR